MRPGRVTVTFNPQPMKITLLTALAALFAFGAIAATPSYNATVAIDGSGDYRTVQAAIDAAPEGRTAPWRIYIKDGFYREQITVPAEKPFIHLIGQSRDWTRIHEKVHVGGPPNRPQNEPEWDKGAAYSWQFSNNNPNSQRYRGNNTGAVAAIHADDFYAENISFVNDWGVDMQTGPQAIALLTYGDRAAFYHCAMRSFQDTWKTSRTDTHRGYAKDCLIEGAVDFIYGTGNYYFDSCMIFVVRDASIIVAPNQKEEAKWGYVFAGCTIDGRNAQGVRPNKVLFGRPWHNAPIAVWLGTRIMVEMAPEGWTEMGGWPRHFSEWRSRDVWGYAVDPALRKRSYTGRDDLNVTKTIEPVLTDAQAAQFTYSNVLSGWDPRKLIQN